MVEAVIKSPGNFSVLALLGPPACVKYRVTGAVNAGRTKDSHRVITGIGAITGVLYMVTVKVSSSEQETLLLSSANT